MFLFSPAKVNLFFKVLSRYKDGYHEIASLISAISLGDSIDLNIASKDDFSIVSDESLPLDQNNLVIKARDLFRERTGILDSLSIHLLKQIPQQAGLGGASTNAATTLWGLNQLFDKPLTMKELIEMGVKIGADVPFFFSSGLAMCTGVGDKMIPIENMRYNRFWIASPQDIKCTTKRVYSVCEVDNRSSDIDLLLAGEIPYYNQLEPIAIKLYPGLENIKRSLLELGFSSVVLTGSGSAFVCIGNIDHPNVKGVDFYSVSRLERPKNTWYSKEVIS